MKLTNDQYNELVEKLADEIIEDGFGKEASTNGLAVKGGALAQAAPRALSLIKKKKSKKALIAGLAGAGALGAGAGAAAIVNKKKDEKEKEASELQNLEEKAAQVYEYALRKIAASEEMYNDGVLYQEACIETLAEAGLYNENGLDKEAAEGSEEALAFTNEVCDIYGEANEKIAAAQECYAEGIEQLGAAMEVLAGFGYEFE